MKVKIKGLVFVGFAAMIFAANAAFADMSDNTVTSKSYVDNKFQTKANIQDSFTDQNRTSTTLYPSMAAVNAELTATGNSIGNGQIDIQLNGTSKGTFTVNQAGPTTVNVNGVEVTSNKTTTLSDQSTDTQYPSAKAVYDAIATSEDATTYNADGTTITLDPDTNTFSATAGSITAGNTGLVNGDAVYDYVQSQTNGNVIPSMPDTCSATAPCVLTNDITTGALTWVPIQQVE